MTYLARQVAKADSGTWGPHTGRSPLHFVLAFCSAALSHSSRPLASLIQTDRKKIMKQDKTFLEAIVHPKIKILPSFKSPSVDGSHWLPHSIFFHTMEVNGYSQLFGYNINKKNLLSSTGQWKTYRFGTTWGWVNNYRFGWNISLNQVYCSFTHLTAARWQS